MPPRWSIRAVCTVQRDLMIGFFIVRKLIELGKVSSRTRDRLLRVYSCKSQGVHVHRMNNHRLDELYQLDDEIPERKKPLYIANQFVHAYTCFIYRDESRNWSDVLIVSDFDRNDCIWRVPIAEIRDLFRTAADDYPRFFSLALNEKAGDYEINTD